MLYVIFHVCQVFSQLHTHTTASAYPYRRQHTWSVFAILIKVWDIYGTWDASFRNLIESGIKRSFLSTMTTFHKIIHWRGSTCREPELTKAPLHCVCRANICTLFFLKMRSDHVIFIPTWMTKRAQDLDLRNDADRELLSYCAYVYALGCHLIANVQWVIPSWPATWRS